MEQASLHNAHGGYDGITPDQRATIGQIGPEGFYVQCGFSGTGFKIAPAVGACVAELIVDGIASTDAGRAAWFKDSEGNILGLIQLD